MRSLGQLLWQVILDVADGIDIVVQEVDLADRVSAPAARLADERLVVTRHERLDREPALGAVESRKVAAGLQRHGECSRNRRRVSVSSPLRAQGFQPFFAARRSDVLRR